MTKREELEALAARVEAAEGATPELDVAIGHAMHRRGWHAADCMARFTASLDAAMTLADDADRAGVLNDAMELTSVCGWQRGDYLGQLTRNVVGQALRGRALLDGEG